MPQAATYTMETFGFLVAKFDFWGKIQKSGIQKFNDLQTAKLSQKQLCDRTVCRRSKVEYMVRVGIEDARLLTLDGLCNREEMVSFSASVYG